MEPQWRHLAAEFALKHGDKLVAYELRIKDSMEVGATMGDDNIMRQLLASRSGHARYAPDAAMRFRAFIDGITKMAEGHMPDKAVMQDGFTTLCALLGVHERMAGFYNEGTRLAGGVGNATAIYAAFKAAEREEQADELGAMQSDLIGLLKSAGIETKGRHGKAERG